MAAFLQYKSIRFRYFFNFSRYSFQTCLLSLRLISFLKIFLVLCTTLIDSFPVCNYLAEEERAGYFLQCVIVVFPYLSKC